jgi:CBS domain-containing protein
MKVKDVMMGTPACCTAETNLGVAVEILWNRNCGILPIVNAEQKVVGVVTDRDICIALGTRNRLAGEIAVGQVTSGKVFACKPEDDVRAALTTMAQAKVRRLPVTNADGKLEGILSMDDVVAHSETRIPGKTSELSHDDVVDTLKRVYRVELPEVVQQKTAAGA